MRFRRPLQHQFWNKRSWSIEDLLAIGLNRSQAQSAAERYAERPWILTEDPSEAVARANAVALTPYDSRISKAFERNRAAALGLICERET